MLVQFGTETFINSYGLFAMVYQNPENSLSKQTNKKENISVH